MICLEPFFRNTSIDSSRDPSRNYYKDPSSVSLRNSIWKSTCSREISSEFATGNRSLLSQSYNISRKFFSVQQIFLVITRILIPMYNRFILRLKKKKRADFFRNQITLALMFIFVSITLCHFRTISSGIIPQIITGIVS